MGRSGASDVGTIGVTTDLKSQAGLFSRMRKMFGDPSERTIAELMQDNKPVAVEDVETRRTERKPQFREAIITLGRSGERFSVAVKDISDGGVKIESFRKLALPPQVEFYEPLSGRRSRARVVWQEDFRAALEFTS